MTLIAPSPAPVGASVGASSTASLWARNKVAFLLALAVLVVVVASALASLGDDGLGGPLDPANPKPEGARAVARVLERHGVEVDVVRGQAAYLASRVDASTAVVVTDADALGTSTLRTLRDHARASSAVLLVGPSTDLVQRLGVLDTGSHVVRGRLEPSCDLSLFRGVLAEVPLSAAYASPGCLGDGDGVLFRQSPTDRSVQLLADGALLSNDRVLDGDNAAVALRLLGQRPRLVWYVADSADTRASDAVAVGPLLPRWLVPGLWLLALSVLGYLLVRGRRLGPLVTEPLPVVVRATESTESRGRLYRRTHDRDHVARVLRAATRRRLASRLSLACDGALAPLVVAVARATGRNADEVGPLLDDRPVPDDPALADLGRALLQIEDEVQRG